MSLFSDIGDAVSSAASDVGSFVEGAADVAGNVAKDMVASTVNSLEHTFDDFGSVLKAAAFATVLSPLSLGMTLYEFGSDIYKETDKELNKK